MNNGNMKDLRILVVDDNIINLKMLSGMIRVLGLTADTACNGYVACEMTLNNDYDLICMDLDMPGMDGFEASKSILFSCRSNKPYIVAVSGTDPSSLALRLKEAGISEFIRKPVILSRIQSLIDDVRDLKKGRLPQSEKYIMKKEHLRSELDYNV